MKHLQKKNGLKDIMKDGIGLKDITKKKKLKKKSGS